jgi:glycosyltransferase 2 family protein
MPDQPPSKRWRIIACLVGVILIAAAVLWFRRLRGSEFRWDQFAATFRQLDPAWLAAAIGLILLTYVGRALRWQVLLRPVSAKPNLWGIFIATAIGFTAVVILGRPGELVRPYLISVKEKVSFSSQIAAWLLERIYDLLVVLLLFGYALSQVHASQLSFGPGLQFILKTGGYLVGAICTGCLFFLLGVRHFSDAMQSRFLAAVSFLPQNYYKRLEQVVKAFAAGMASTKSHSFVALLLFYTATEWLIIVAGNLCLFRAFPATSQFTVTDTLVFCGFVGLGSAIQIPGVGGGMQVASVLILTEFFGLTLEVSSAVAIFMWLITYVVIVPIGAFLALREGLNWKNLKQLEARLPE